MAAAAKRVLKLPEGLTLYFSRHGETEANIAKRFQGHTIDTPLTDKGLKQTKAIAKILKARVDDPAALKYVASPLPRTRLTMMLVRDHLGLSIDDFKTDARLSEIDLGKWDGLTHKEARKLDPKLFDKREADKWNVRVPGGESYADVADRAERWVKSLKADTFAISHGAFTRILRGLFEGLSAAEMSALDEPQGVVFRVRGSKVKEFEKP
ncbi:MAG TPA: histidine phosphatase family protein [Rhizomicrobium sp.]|nr:histidine phosphatase family protein [Rhizomicrobium sp.]